MKIIKNLYLCPSFINSWILCCSGSSDSDSSSSSDSRYSGSNNYRTSKKGKYEGQPSRGAPKYDVSLSSDLNWTNQNQKFTTETCRPQS